ncbi:MAG: ABC transporter substrate-binding protein [Chloroflexi bacterium]|nr:ABC transporter substrate-binding protein [Chloroflexota bacterium]
MKLGKIAFGLLAITITALFVAACGGAATPQPASAPQQQAAPAAAPAQAPAPQQQAAPAQPQAPAQPAPAAPAAPVQSGAPLPVPTVAIAAVAQERRPAPTPTGQQAIPGGILVPLAGFDLGHTDPHRNTSVAELSYMTHIYPGILQYSTETWVDVVPDLATSWEVDSSGKVYTFKVRDGVTYSDGTAVSSEDMAYSLNRMVERPNDIAMPRSGCIRGFMDGAQAVDPATLQVSLKDPAVGFLGCVASPWISIPPKSILEEVDTGADPGRQLELDEVIGAGPFILKNYQRGISFEVERNASYYDQPFPYLDGVRHVIVTDPSSRVAAFRTGHAHKEAVFPAFGADDDIAIREQMGDRLFVSETVGFGVGGIHINLRNAPFDDVRVRQALQLATDREAMIELIHPAGGEPQCYYPCIFDWIYTVEDYMQIPGFRFDQKAEDIEEAKRLLAEAGYPDGFDATITFRKVGPYPDYSAIVAQQWKEIGIDLTLRPMESAAGFAAYQQGDFEINWQGTGLNFLDPDAANDLLWLPTAGRNYQGWENAEFIALFNEEKQEVDQSKRGELLRQMTDILLQDVPYIPGTQGIGFHLQYSCVKDYTQPRALGQNNYRFDRVWLDQEEPCR